MEVGHCLILILSVQVEELHSVRADTSETSLKIFGIADCSPIDKIVNI